MNAYKVTLLVLDFDQLGGKGIADTLENTRYPNRCIAPQVVSVEERDIGEWEDNNPLNFGNRWRAEYDRLFGTTQDSPT